MNSRFLVILSAALASCCLPGCSDDSGQSEVASACDESAKPGDACTCSESTGTWDCGDAPASCDESAKPGDACTCNESTGEWDCGDAPASCDESAKPGDDCTCNEAAGEWDCGGKPSACDTSAKPNDSCTCNEATGEWENCNLDCQNDCSEEGEKKCGEDTDILECIRDDAGCLKWNVAETCLEGRHCDAASHTCAPAADEPKVFRAGFARVNITPILSLPLRGYGNTLKRMSLGYLDPLYANCVAMTDENGATVLLYMLDLIGATPAYADPAREAISKATGIPINNIFLQGSHTHSGPDLSHATVKETSYSNYSTEEVKGIMGIKYYSARIADALTQAAFDALDDRAPAILKTGNIEVEGLNFVRHYKLQDGTYCGDNFGDCTSSKNPIVAHESEADHTLQILQFERKDKKDILLLNFQTHVTRTGGSAKKDVSADIVGQIRNNVEKELGVWSSYLQGAAGNINPTSRIATENRTTDYKEYGVLFTQSVVDCLKNNMSDINAGNIKVSPYTFTGKINHTEDYKKCAARKLYLDWLDDRIFNDTEKFEDLQKWLNTNCKDIIDTNKITKDNINNILAESCKQKPEGAVTSNDLKTLCDIHSGYHASSIVSKANLKETGQFDVSTLAFGDVGLICAPFELFDVNGDYVKDNSNFKRTLIMGYCNGSNSYLPANYSYDNTSYEVDQCKYEKGTAEDLAKQYVSMLNDYDGTADAVDYTVKQNTALPPKVSQSVYWNIDFETYHSGTNKNRSETSGKYNINMTAQDGSAVTKSFATKEVAAEFDKYPIRSIVEKDGVVTDVGTVEDAGFVLGADNYWVKYYDKESVTLNSSPAFNGVEKTFKINSETKRILVPAVGKTKATVTDRFRTEDRVWIVSDKDDNAIAAFITERVANTDEEEEHYGAPVTSKCKHCDKVVEWQDWYDRNTLPTNSGHYRLMRDGALTGQMSMGLDAHICLDLNGHTYLGKENARMYSIHNQGGVLALMDNCKAGNGGLKAQGTKTAAQGVVVWARYGEAYIYDGIYDASNIENSSSGNVFEGAANTKAYIYGGKFIGGKSYYNGGGSGGAGATLSVKGACTIYDGTFIGGNAETSVSDKGGYGGIVNVASGGELDIRGGSFSGGKSTRLGGCVSVFGKMTMSGGEIKDCDSKTGKVLYVGSTGDARITGGHVDGAVGGSDGKVYVYGTGKLECDKKYCY